MSQEIRALIIAYHKSSKRNRQIAEELQLNRRTMRYIVKKHVTCTTISNIDIISNKKRCGRSRKTMPTEDRYTMRTSKRNRRLTAPEIASQINLNHSDPVNTTTMKRRLIEPDFFRHVAIIKLLLKIINKKKDFSGLEHTKTVQLGIGKMPYGATTCFCSKIC
ncbi:uncharacterized protein [Euwallacea similis]|uniref:uncharacterized protein n=1 Tax=Euwallacea similis TaxID=1736056 RepID=UPI00344D0CC8